MTVCVCVCVRDLVHEPDNHPEARILPLFWHRWRRRWFCVGCPVHIWFTFVNNPIQDSIGVTVRDLDGISWLVTLDVDTVLLLTVLPLIDSRRACRPGTLLGVVYILLIVVFSQLLNTKQNEKIQKTRQNDS